MSYWIVALVVVTAYYKTVHCGLIVDDLFWRKSKVEKWKFNLRPKALLLRLYGGGTLGKSVKLDHCFAIFLHIIVCSLINHVFGIIPALLYAVNPANHQTAIWLNGRRYQINIILVLIIMTIGPMGLVLYPLTALFQVNAIFLPVYFSWWGLLVVPVIALMFRKKIKKRWEKIPKNNVKDFKSKRIIIIVKTYGYYFFRMIVPDRGYTFYSFLYDWGLSDQGDKRAYSMDSSFYRGIIAISVSLAGCYFYGLPFVFMVLAIGQWCNIVTCTMNVADRYMSLPNVLMMFFVSDIVLNLLGIYGYLVLAGLFVYYFVRLQDTIPMYEDIESMYRYHAHYKPDQVTCRSFYVRDLMASNKYCQAWTHICEGLFYNPGDFGFLFQGGICAFKLGDKKKAKEFLLESRERIYKGQEDKWIPVIDKELKGLKSA